MPTARHFIICCLLCIPLLGQAQDLLWVQKSPWKRKLVEPGDSIMVKFVGEGYAYPYFYRGARGSYIYVRNDSIPVSEVSELWVRRSRNSRYWLSMMAGNGIAVSLFTTAGALINQPRSWWTTGNTLVLGAIVAGGIAFAKLMIRFAWRRYKIRGNAWQLRIVPPIERSVGGPGG